MMLAIARRAAMYRLLGMVWLAGTFVTTMLTGAAHAEQPLYVVGSDKQNPAQLACYNWHSPPGQIFSQQEQLTRNPVANGFWALEIEREGRYEITLRNRPVGMPGKLTAVKAEISVGGAFASTVVQKGSEQVVFDLKLLRAGKTQLKTFLIDADDTERGAFFVVIKRIE